MLRVPFFLVLGLRKFTRGGYERASQSFDPSFNDRDMKGVSALITGANQGLGFQTSLDLARRGTTVYMACRNEQRGLAAVEKVKAESGNVDVHLCLCDVSSLASIAAMGAQFSDKKLDVLVNNAGVMVHEPQQSADGYEVNFATNTLGALAVTRALEPALRRAAPSRVVFVSSGGALTEGLEVDDLEGKEKIQPGKEFATLQYAKDKRRQIAMAEALAREWKDAGITPLVMHPGWTDTVGVQTSIPSFHKSFKDKLRTLPQGADTIVWLCGEDLEKLEPGGFYLDRSLQSKHLPLAGTKYADAEAERLLCLLDGMIVGESSAKDAAAGST